MNNIQERAPAEAGQVIVESQRSNSRRPWKQSPRKAGVLVAREGRQAVSHQQATELVRTKRLKELPRASLRPLAPPTRVSKHGTHVNATQISNTAGTHYDLACV